MANNKFRLSESKHKSEHFLWLLPPLNINSTLNFQGIHQKTTLISWLLFLSLNAPLPLFSFYGHGGSFVCVLPRLRMMGMMKLLEWNIKHNLPLPALKQFCHFRFLHQSHKIVSVKQKIKDWTLCLCLLITKDWKIKMLKSVILKLSSSTISESTLLSV